MKQLLRKYNNLKLTVKMVLVYLVSAGSFFAIALLIIQITLNMFSEKLYDESLTKLDYYVQSVNHGLSEVENQTYQVAMNQDVQEQLATMKSISPDTVPYQKMMTEMRNYLVYQQNPSSTVRAISYQDSHGKSVEVGAAGWEISAKDYQEAMESFKQARGAFAVYGPVKGTPYLLCGREIRNSLDMSLDSLGVLMMTCDIEKIITDSKENLQSERAELLIYNDAGVIYQDLEAIDGLELPQNDERQGYRIIKHDGERYFMCFMQSNTGEWKYVNLLPYSEIFGRATAMRVLMSLGFVFLFILSVFIMRKVSSVITHPLEQLSKSMQIAKTGDFKGAMQIPVAEDRKDEIGILSREFGNMIEKIEALIQEDYKNQLLIKDTKYQMLRAQINPHFLYNTLTTLRWLVKQKKNEEAAEMIVELGSLLRSSFAKEPYTYAAEELNMVNSYIAIQKYRYQNRVNFRLEQVGSMEQYVVPRMLLQPLVENALYHGAENTNQMCDISVLAIEKPETLCFTVSDTGPGMSEEALLAVRNLTIEPKGHGIGVKNIHERLKIIYDTFTFQVDSKLDVGTKVVIEVPKLVKWKE